MVKTTSSESGCKFYFELGDWPCRKINGDYVTTTKFVVRCAKLILYCINDVMHIKSILLKYYFCSHQFVCVFVDMIDYKKTVTVIVVKLVE